MRDHQRCGYHPVERMTRPIVPPQVMPITKIFNPGSSLEFEALVSQRDSPRIKNSYNERE